MNLTQILTEINKAHLFEDALLIEFMNTVP